MINLKTDNNTKWPRVKVSDEKFHLKQNANLKMIFNLTMRQGYTDHE